MSTKLQAQWATASEFFERRKIIKKSVAGRRKIRNLTKVHENALFGAQKRRLKNLYAYGLRIMGSVDMARELCRYFPRLRSEMITFHWEKQNLDKALFVAVCVTLENDTTCDPIPRFRRFLLSRKI